MKIFKKMKNRNNSFHKSRHKKKMIKSKIMMIKLKLNNKKK